MSTPGDLSQGRPSYIAEFTDAPEMTHLVLLDRVTTEALGGPLAERTDQEAMSRVLDVGCGPGSRVLSAAHAYPHMSVVGVDTSHLMVDYAQAQARRAGLTNTHFEAVNALDKLHFPDASFDLVNISFAATFVPRQDWPRLLRACLRVLRPGGTLRLTETDLFGGVSTSQAREACFRVYLRFLNANGFGFSPDGYTLGITPLLTSMLAGLGCVDIHRQSRTIDASYGSSTHTAICLGGALVSKIFQPLAVQQGITTAEELQRLEQQMNEEMQQKDYHALMYVLTAWGQKPTS